LAAAVGCRDIDQFCEQYVRQVGIRKSLKEFSNGDCVFFDNQTRKCQVYEARPRQCRTWPFWDSNVKTPEAWAQTCQVCPGSGRGRLYQLEQIDERRTVIRL
jgi:Fe-S-cluster containining protein